MGSYIFKKEQDIDNRFDNYTLEMRSTDVSLIELLENFEAFLRGCGFHFTGTLEIVEADLPSLDKEEE